MACRSTRLLCPRGVRGRGWDPASVTAQNPARRWEPKRLRLLSLPPTLARHGRRVLPNIKNTAPWADVAPAGHGRLLELAGTDLTPGCT